MQHPAKIKEKLDETLKLIAMMHGTHQLMAKLIYGCGLRVMECIRLRVKDIDFEMNQIVVRDGKGKKDRITVLPDGIKSSLIEHDDLHACSQSRGKRSAKSFGLYGKTQGSLIL